jgi:hypothetical protein
MTGGWVRLALTALMPALAAPAAALDFEIGDGLHLKMINRFTVGAGVRTQDRHIDALGILNTPGQQTLCELDDCISFSGNREPTQRLVDAAGGISLHGTDDGNMNYDQGDVYTVLSKLNADWTLNWGEWTFKTNFVGYFDAINAGFETRRFNTVRCTGADPSAVCKRATGPGTPNDDYDTGLARSPRTGELEYRLGVRGEFREYFVTRSFFVGDYEVFATLGNQRLRWGEANLTLLNTLDVINPQDAVLARQPGLALNELSLPVGLLSFGSDVLEGVSLDAWIQYDWEPVRPEPAGSLFSVSDVAGGGDFAVLAPHFPEDPDGLWFSRGTTGLVSNSHRTAFFADEKTHAPDDFGQYGVRVKWFLPDFNNGTELGFYFANYHSRLPYLSAFAAQDSCLREATTIAEAANQCNGFNAASNRGDPTPGLAPERCDPRGCNLDAYLAREGFTIDTMRLFLEFPEDIQMYGVSFNTTVGGWSFAGEYSYRPNLPAQLLIGDLLMAGLQPAVGRRNLPFAGLGAFTPDPGADPNTAARVQELLADFAETGDPDAANAVLPGARQIFPDYITPYRGYDNNDPNRDINAGQYIAGYERLKVGQFALTALQLFSTNPFASDDLLMVYEIGFTHVIDMPERGTLYFQGAGDYSHPSPGADCSGFPAGTVCATPEVTGRINPTQQTEGFADDFAWGVRGLIQLNYSNLFDSGINVKPTVLAFWDVDGIAPSPMQNYVEHNRWIVPAFFFEYGSDWSGTLIYQYFAGPYTLLADRDNISASITYSF